MIVYVDSSVLLRVVLGEPDRLREWRRIVHPVSSELIRVECLRTIDRARLRLSLSDAAVARSREGVLEHLDAFELVRLDDVVLARAADPFPTQLGSLDALHLATAILLRPTYDELQLATHDAELGTAARAVGFRVLGSARP